MVSLGAVVLPSVAPERLRSIARAAEEAGLEELWLWEDCFLNGGISTGSAVLASTSRLRVGIGLLPVPLRNVAITAMELSSLHRMFPGRVLAGVGHGVQAWMGQANARVASPLTLLREYAVALRALLAGETVTVDGRYVRLDAVRLAWPPEQAVPTLVGAVGPKTLRLAGEIADGIILDAGLTPDQARRAIATAATGRETSTWAEPPRIAAYVMAATGPDAQSRLAADVARRGFPADAEITVSGSAADMAAGIARWVSAGVDSVVLQPTPDDPSPEQFLRFVAKELRPLLS